MAAALATTSNKSLAVTALAPSTGYNFTVNVRDLFGASKPSAALAVKTLPKPGGGSAGPQAVRLPGTPAPSTWQVGRHLSPASITRRIG